MEPQPTSTVVLSSKSLSIFNFINSVSKPDMPIIILLNGEALNITFIVDKNHKDYTKDQILTKIEKLGARNNVVCTRHHLTTFSARFTLKEIATAPDGYMFKQFSLNVHFPDENLNDDLLKYLNLNMTSIVQKYNPKIFKYEEKS